MKVDAITLNSQVGFKEAVMNERTWEWQNNTYDLKVTKNETTQIWNCSPYVMICDAFGPNIDPEFSISIEMNRSFEWTKNKGWTWHRNWTLPSITLGFSVKIGNGRRSTH